MSNSSRWSEKERGAVWRDVNLSEPRLPAPNPSPAGPWGSRGKEPGCPGPGGAGAEGVLIWEARRSACSPTHAFSVWFQPEPGRASASSSIRAWHGSSRAHHCMLSLRPLPSAWPDFCPMGRGCQSEITRAGCS